MTVKEFKKVNFVVEGSPLVSIGWSDGSSWSGGEIAYFEKDEADKILEDFNSYFGVLDKKAEYNQTSDTYVFPNDDGVDEFKGMIIQTPEGKKKVYNIEGWTWEQIK